MQESRQTTYNKEKPDIHVLEETPQTLSNIDIDVEAERRLVRKIDLHLIVSLHRLVVSFAKRKPVVWVMFLFSNLDSTYHSHNPSHLRKN